MKLLLVILAAISGPLGFFIGVIFGMGGAIAYTIGVVFGLGVGFATWSKDDIENEEAENVNVG